jgi:hypothetical protein
MAMFGIWNGLDRSYGIFSCGQIKETMKGSFARLGNSDKTIAKATAESNEIRERKAPESMTKSKRAQV